MDVSDIFYFFLIRGGEGGVQGHREGRGGRFFIENPRRGGLVGEGGRGGEGREGVCREFGEGGGLNIFFRGRNARQGQVFHAQYDWTTGCQTSEMNGRSKGNGGATTKGNDQSRPRKNPRASKRTSRRFFCGSS